ncbi:MAG TPA: archaeal heat shock protein Hsp20 [Nitrososphaerales archaeon]|nr:archaeal heat shock protein Hsp20 [Nitrososphaerales archaeon]
MSSEDKWFKRWGKMMPFGPWSYADVEEMMKEMEKNFMDMKDIANEVPKDLVREKRAKDGSITREIGPIVYGYSMTVGPDGKPVIREFGNVKRGPNAGWKEALSEAREPLVDVVDGDKEVRVIAELPGAKKEDIELTAEGKSLTISAETPARKYRKVLELPSPVEPEGSKSSFNNGILEVTFLKRKGRSSGVRIKVD